MAGSAKVFSANDGTGTFTLLLFASASTYTGIETLTLPAPTTLRELFRLLEGKFPGITDKVLKSSAVTVNLEYVDSFEPEDLGKEELRRQGEDGEGLDTVIRQGDEVGIIPPTVTVVFQAGNSARGVFAGWPLPLGYLLADH